MSDKLGYWPGQDNGCDEIPKCGGAGTPEHTEHVLTRLSFSKLVGAILSCCGGERGGPNPVMSCMCCFYAQEIGRRGTIRGWGKHREAVEAYKKYIDNKFGLKK